MNCPRCAAVAAPGQTTCQTCGSSLDAPTYAAPPGYPPPGMMMPGLVAPGYPAPAATPVGGLSIATTVVLGLIAVVQLLQAISRIGSSSGFGLSLISTTLQIAIIPLFIIWFFMIRRNAGLWGPQRRAQGWSIGAWFVPIIFLWFPFQIAADAWTASLPADSQNRRTPPIVIGWWICWLLAWFTGFRIIESTTTNGSSTVTNHTVGVFLGSTLVSNLFAAAAAALGALMVRELGRMQEARRQGPQ